MTSITTYDKAAAQWDRKLNRLGYTAAYAAFFDRTIVPNGTVLDVGTGTGAFAQAWVAAGGSDDLTLLDTSQQMLDRSAQRFAARGLQPKLIQRPFLEYAPDQPFQAVLAAHVIEHFDDPEEGLARMAQVLAPGGKLYLAVSRPHWCNWLIWLKFRHRWFAEQTVIAMAKTAGLQLQSCSRFPAGPPGRTSLGYIFSKPPLTP